MKNAINKIVNGGKSFRLSFIAVCVFALSALSLAQTTGGTTGTIDWGTHTDTLKTGLVDQINVMLPFILGIFLVFVLLKNYKKILGMFGVRS